MEGLTHRLARIGDLTELRALMRRSIDRLQDEFLTPAQVWQATRSWAWTRS
jgi:hypothetical protein